MYARQTIPGDSSVITLPAMPVTGTRAPTDLFGAPLIIDILEVGSLVALAP